jgi:hypothetical protein
VQGSRAVSLFYKSRSGARPVHLDFCEVAIVEDGEVRSAGRIETKPQRIELFAGSLAPVIVWRWR